MSTPDEDFVLHVAECTAVLAMALEENGIKLGGDGLIAHYCAVAQYGLEVARLFPMDYDWDEHMANGGDCWDIEVCDWLSKRLHVTEDIPFEYWIARGPAPIAEPPNGWHGINMANQPDKPVKQCQDIDLTIPE
jgi:hypothetical protein